MARNQEVLDLCLCDQNIPTKWNNSITVLIHKKEDENWKDTDQSASLIIFISFSPKL